MVNMVYVIQTSGFIRLHC